jgi:hypothetical protein
MAIPATTAVLSVYGPRPPKVHHCVTVQDGHSVSENALYVLLWNQLGTLIDDETKLIQISLSRLAKRASMSLRNLQTLLERLETKLTIEVAAKNNFSTGAPKSYYVYSYRKILVRRRAAGLEWVIKNKGVQFVSRDEAERIEALRREIDDIADSGRPAVAVSAIAPSSFGALSAIAKTAHPAIAETAEPAIAETAALPYIAKKTLDQPPPPAAFPAQLGRDLRTLTPSFDDPAITRLWRDCRIKAPDCTTDEVLHFTRLKLEQIGRNPNIYNRVGMILTSVPSYFTGAALAEHRAEIESQRQELARAAEENRRFWQQTLDDPSLPQEEKDLARRMLEVPKEPLPDS